MMSVVLCAGEGTRMRPLTYTKPKVMLPVANKPILEYIIDALSNAGVKDVILVVGYMEEAIRNYFGDGSKWGVNIKYIKQKKQLGTADALKSASHLLKEEFLMLNGDSVIFAEDIRRLINTDSLAMGVFNVDNPKDYGVVVLNEGRVEEILEKPEVPPSNMINAGIYKFTPEILDFLESTPISKRGEYEITDTIRLAIKAGLTVKAVKLKEWLDVGYPWQLLDANECVLKRIKAKIDGEVEDGAHLKGNVVVGNGTVIRAGSYIIGPVIIGKNCDIGPNCFIRPYTSIGDNCHIGNAVEIKNSIVMSKTKVPHLNYIGDSVIGENCNFGAGTKIANLRLDGGMVYATIKGRKISTGRKKFGAVIGDNVKTGINVSINVGTLIGNDVQIAPSAKVEGYIEPHSRVF